jgi:hypothetical protein
MRFTFADHVTEREPGRWEDCTFASMLETIRLAMPNGRRIPSTIAEVNRFARAAGFPEDHSGATIEDALPAATRLYGVTARHYDLSRDWRVVRRALADERTVAVVTGVMAAVPAHLRRWSPRFTGAHAVAARGHSVSPTWCDPLAPKGTYAGEPVNWSVWEAFFRTLPGSQAMLMEAAEEDYIPMPIYEQTPRGGTITLAPNTPLRIWAPEEDRWVVHATVLRTTPWTARIDARLRRIGGDTKPSSLYRISAGGMAGYYVSTADVAVEWD